MVVRRRPATNVGTRARVRIPRNSRGQRLREGGVSQFAKGSLLAGGVVAAGAATLGAIVMRQKIASLAENVASEAVEAGHTIGTLGSRFVKSLDLDRLDMTSLMTRLGLRKPSLFRRLIQPVGAVVGLAAATAAALLYLAPELASGAFDDEDERRAKPARRVRNASDNAAGGRDVGGGTHGPR